MDPLLSIRRLAIATAFTALTSASLNAQEITPSRFGLGVSGIAGRFGGYAAVFPGVEGFVRVAHGSFWSARLDGAFYAGKRLGDLVCAAQGNGDGCGDGRYLGKIGTLVATLALGPTARSGLRPFYGVFGAGGMATQWGGGIGPSGGGNASGAGPSLGLIEAGVGSEFHAIGGNRIEVRVHRAFNSLPGGNPTPLAAVGMNVTIGVVW